MDKPIWKNGPMVLIAIIIAMTLGHLIATNF